MVVLIKCFLGMLYLSIQVWELHITALSPTQKTNTVTPFLFYHINKTGPGFHWRQRVYQSGSLPGILKILNHLPLCWHVARARTAWSTGPRGRQRCCSRNCSLHVLSGHSQHEGQIFSLFATTRKSWSLKTTALGTIGWAQSSAELFSFLAQPLPEGPHLKLWVRIDPPLPAAVSTRNHCPLSAFQIYTMRDQIIFLFRNQSVSLCHLTLVSRKANCAPAHGWPLWLLS